jgi:hypothetical protein
MFLANVAQTNVGHFVRGVAQPPPPLPALPVVARVWLDVTKERVLVVHEIVMARGDFAGGDLDLWTSFGPTLPRAYDAHLLSMSPNASAPAAADPGEPIAIDKLAHRPPHAHPLLGRSSMAGAVLHLREPAFRRAIAASNMLGLRIRQVLPVPPPDADGAREIVVRLGIESSTPLAVRRIDLSTSEPAGWLTTASAQLCGPKADPYIIGFASAPPGTQHTAMPIDPSAATRHTTDDLCVRYVASQ